MIGLRDRSPLGTEDEQRTKEWFEVEYLVRGPLQVLRLIVRVSLSIEGS